MPKSCKLFQALQIHLLTAIVLMMVAAAFLWKNTEKRSHFSDNVTVCHGPGSYQESGWNYGWPEVCMARVARSSRDQVGIRVNWRLTAVNCAWFAGILVCTATSSEWVLRRRAMRQAGLGLKRLPIRE